MSVERGVLRRWISRVLLVFGAACLTFYAIVTARAAWYQHEAVQRVEQLVTIDRPPELTHDAVAASTTLTRGTLIGRLDIPRLDISVAVAEGDDEQTLSKAVGHLPDTPLPWHGRGNAAFAGHRDGLFRPLKHIQPDDDIKLVTPRGEYLYRVTATHIVDPDALWVLAPTDAPTLTLITCYPFAFIGHAPQRFVVQATLAGHVAGSALTGAVVK